MASTAFIVDAKPDAVAYNTPQTRTGIIDTQPVTKIGKTTAQLYDQGLTFNEAGITFNEPGVAFGGVYGAQGYVEEMNAVALNRPPQSNYITDLPGTNTPPTPSNSGMLIGMLGLTYP